MTLAEFEKKVAADSNSSLRASRIWTKVVLDCLADAIMTEDVVSLYGFGTFEQIVRKPKVGRNAKTGERIEIPSKIVSKYTPCKKIKAVLSSKPIPDFEHKCDDETE